MQKGFTEILVGLEKEQRRKLAVKIPQWSFVEGLVIPGSLSLEQCSSAATALYKASLAPKGSIADLTSGLGVDVWAFAIRDGISKVYYNDINQELYNAVLSNFRLLGLENVEFTSLSADERLDSLGKVDMIFIDPARRSASGTKVFRLEDCSPDLLQLLPKIWEHTDTAMAKLSPMADISLVAKQLPFLAEIHIVGTALECKELLCIMRKGWDSPYSVTVAELKDGVCKTVVFEGDKDCPTPIAGTLQAGNLLLEPCPAMAKSGLAGEICKKFGLIQLDKSTHLFTFDGKPDSLESLTGFFRIFEVLEVGSFNKSTFKKFGESYPVADVSARNVPIKSDELKKRMGISGSGDIHIFGTSVNSERILAACRQFSAA